MSWIVWIRTRTEKSKISSATITPQPNLMIREYFIQNEENLVKMCH